MRPRLRDGMRIALPVFLVALAATVVISAVTTGAIHPLDPVDVPGWPTVPATGGLHHVFAATERQDALWFLRIAATGYRQDDPSAAFFPLYPGAIRAVSAVIGGHRLAAGLLVAWASYLGALAVLATLTLEEFGGDEPMARRTVVLVAIFPTAFFLLAPYSESLFLLLTVATLREARRDHWPAAAVLGVLAALTRSVGVLLVPALAIEAWQRARTDGRGLRPRLAAACAPAAGPAILLLGWWIAGDAWAPIHAQSNWQRTAAWFPATLARAAVDAWRLRSYWLLDAVVVGTVLVVLIAGIRRLRPVYSVYAWLSLILPLSYPFPDRPLLSVPRFASVLFPVAWVLAGASARRPRLYAGVLLTFLGGYVLMLSLFSSWRYVF